MEHQITSVFINDDIREVVLKIFDDEEEMRYPTQTMRFERAFHALMDMCRTLEKNSDNVHDITQFMVRFGHAHIFEAVENYKCTFIDFKLMRQIMRDIGLKIDVDSFVKCVEERSRQNHLE